MTIRASIVADSINPTGNRLTTWLLYYPRCIHSEVLTHRAFSRNSASSRAIPIKTMIASIKADPFIPKWGKAQKGMGVSEFFDGEKAEAFTRLWLDKLDLTVKLATYLADAGVAKGNVNRLLEPWMHIEVVLSGTEFKNFFLLRDHPAAEPSLRDLAALMKDVYTNSDPIRRETHAAWTAWCNYETWVVAEASGTDRYAWHLPFVQEGYDRNEFLDVIKESIAHAAWVSYGNAAGKEGFTQEDVDRVYNTLLESQPLHASPAEHVAVACDGPHRHGNFVGWKQWRGFLPGEAGGDYAK